MENKEIVFSSLSSPLAQTEGEEMTVYKANTSAPIFAILIAAGPLRRITPMEPEEAMAAMVFIDVRP